MADVLTIYPAIDLRAGRVVRLREGDPAQQTIYSDDPLEVARRWVAAGATWLHVVNLDGALEEGGEENWRVLPDLVATGAQVQFGGGLRTLKDIARALHRGVARVILGTAAVEEPDLVADAVDRFGAERIVVSLDARDGRVRSHGWQSETEVSPEELGWQMNAVGVTRVLFTDISRDGLQTGVNASATAKLADETGLAVIASGGVRSLDDIIQLRRYVPMGVEGVVIGRALYDGTIDLDEALRVAGGG